MNDRRRAILAPLLAVLALLLGLTATAPAAFNRAATEAPYCDFLLWESEASGFQSAAIPGGIRDRGPHGYDCAPGLPPWSRYDPYGLWETGSYWGDVGQVFVGYGRAIKGTAVGLYTVARHPVQTAQGIKAAASDPVGTFNAIKNDYGDKLQTNAGTGEIIGEVLIGVATGGTLKTLDKAGDVADVARITNKLEDAADVGGDSARTTQKLNQARTIEVDGIEFKGQRDLGHLSDADLKDIKRTGNNPPNAKGDPMVQHHIGQDPAGPAVEMPRKYHNIHNRTQHPKGNEPGVGLTKQERKDFDRTRRKLNRQRANDEIEKRGASE